jgi:hypothetical protein
VQGPVARDHYSVAIASRMQQFPIPHTGGAHLSKNLVQWCGKLRFQERVADLPNGFIAGKTIQIGCTWVRLLSPE